MLKKVFFTTNLLVFSSLLFCNYVHAEDLRSGKVFVDAALLTNYYSYSNEDIRNKLPEEYIENSNVPILAGHESDWVNYSLGIGYYISNDWNVKVTYSDKISFGFLDGIFDNFVSSVDLRMIDIDTTYYPFHFTEKFSPYIVGGMVYNHLTYNRRSADENSSELPIKGSANDWDFKAGLGIQWDLSRYFAMKLGYTYYNYAKMDKYYLNFEFKF